MPFLLCGFKCLFHSIQTLGKERYSVSFIRGVERLFVFPALHTNDVWQRALLPSTLLKSNLTSK